MKTEDPTAKRIKVFFFKKVEEGHEEKIRMMLSGKDPLHCPGFEDGSRRSWQPQELEGQGGR